MKSKYQININDDYLVFDFQPRFCYNITIRKGMIVWKVVDKEQ